MENENFSTYDIQEPGKVGREPEEKGSRKKKNPQGHSPNNQPGTTRSVDY